MASRLSSVRQGIRSGARHFSKSPGFFVSAVATLAVGIGANTVMFAVLHGVLLKPLPFDDPDRLVSIYSAAPSIGWPRAVLCAAQYFTYRDERRAFQDVAAWTGRSLTVTGVGEPERVRALAVTDGFLPLLGVTPAVGRAFTREDDSPAGTSSVILSHDYWQERFGGDRRAVGRQLALNGRSAEIVGILPRGFRFMDADAAILVPLAFNRAATTILDFSYLGLARLKPGVTLEQANADVARMLPMVSEKFPPSPALGAAWFRNARMAPDVHPLADDAAGDVGRLLWTLMAAVGMLLLIACANVANLFLVRAEARRQEFAVRAALGAGRVRIAASLLGESLVLGLCGGVVGLLLAWAGVRLVIATAPDALPRVGEIGLDPVVLLFAFALSAAAGVAFGLLPVLKFASPRLGALNDGGRTASEGRDRHRARSLLVVSEIALSLVMLVGSGLMIRTYLALSRVDPGYVRGEEVLTFDVAAGRPGLVGEALARRHEEFVRRIEQVPGVRSVGLTSAATLSSSKMSNPVMVEEFPQPDGEAVVSRRMKWISPGYLETLGTRVLAGRTIAWNEMYGFAPVAIINERMARAYWKSPAEAIGKRIRATTKSPWREIVGVVDNERDDGLGQPAPPEIYYPFLVRDFFLTGISSQATLTYAVRSPRAGSESLLKEVRQAVASVDANVPMARVRTLETIAGESMSGTSFALSMLLIAASAALLLGLVGIYGVVSYVAVQRTREVGIRVALGAEPGQVTTLFLRQGALLAASGVGAGLGAALGLSRLMGSLLFGVSPFDPATYGAVSALLVVVTLAAGYLPARRAARLDPVKALRSSL